MAKKFTLQPQRRRLPPSVQRFKPRPHIRLIEIDLSEFDACHICGGDPVVKCELCGDPVCTNCISDDAHANDINLTCCKVCVENAGE